MAVTSDSVSPFLWGEPLNDDEIEILTKLAAMSDDELCKYVVSNEGSNQFTQLGDTARHVLRSLLGKPPEGEAVKAWLSLVRRGHR